VNWVVLKFPLDCLDFDMRMLNASLSRRVPLVLLVIPAVVASLCVTDSELMPDWNRARVIVSIGTRLSNSADCVNPRSAQPTGGVMKSEERGTMRAIVARPGVYSTEMLRWKRDICLRTSVDGID
jgi:hypothetical protein